MGPGCLVLFPKAAHRSVLPNRPCAPCTGHGAAGTFDCARRMWRTTPTPPRLVHYNYGSPRVGNRAFAAEVGPGLCRGAHFEMTRALTHALKTCVACNIISHIA